MPQPDVVLDGSIGEGGGQILRTALALSLATGRALRIERIRAGRKKPGLLRQHLTAVQAAARVGGAKVEGANLGSATLSFAPSGIHAGAYAFAVGTAGSTTLVLQTILPALLLASGPSTVSIEGGTHNPFAPPFDFIDCAFLPLVRRMGPKAESRLERYGFFPAGGGRISVSIEPAPFRRLDLGLRGEIRARRMRAVVSNLPIRIARTEIDRIRERLSWAEEEGKAEEVNSPGPGNAAMIEIESEGVTELFTAFGERGLPAEAVADRAVDEARRYLASSAAGGEYLTDQLLLPMALAGGGSFTSTGISPHASTNMDVIRAFLDADFATSPADGAVRVEVKRRG